MESDSTLTVRTLRTGDSSAEVLPYAETEAHSREVTCNAEILSDTVQSTRCRSDRAINRRGRPSGVTRPPASNVHPCIETRDTQPPLMQIDERSWDCLDDWNTSSDDDEQACQCYPIQCSTAPCPYRRDAMSI